MKKIWYHKVRYIMPLDPYIFHGIWCDCGCGESDGYKSDFEVLSVTPDYARVDIPVGLDAATELLSTLHQYLMHKKLLPRPIDASASQAEDDLASSFGSKEFFHRMGTAASLKNVSSQITALAHRTNVLMLHLRGHGSQSGFRLLDKYLTATHIVECLKTAGFTGTAVCVLNCCHADPIIFPDSQDPVTPSVWSPDLPFKWVLISSTPREGTQMAVHGNKVTKLVAALVRERVRYSDLEVFIHQWWTPKIEDIEAWKTFCKPPHVSKGGLYSGRFMEPALHQSECT